MKKLAIITTHPIQYNAPVFKLLTARNNINIKVFYTWGETVLKNKYDPGFGKVIDWDIPLLQGYDYSMVENLSSDPGSHHYKGIVNPGLNSDIIKWGADAVLIFGWNFKSHFAAMRYFHGRIPVLFRGDSTNLDLGGNVLKNLIRRIALKFIYLFTDKLLYTGKANKDYYSSAGVGELKLVFAPHAIDNKRFSASTNLNFKEKLKLPEDAVLFLYAGKFEEKKNVNLLIDAFLKLASKKANLLLVGNGPQEKTIKLKVDNFENSIKSRIHFLDFQNQSLMPDLYQSCDVFILPSKGPGETWGLAINEAMASSKPIIVSDKCGVSQDLISDGFNGYVFESNNTHSLVEKMNYFISHKNKIIEFGFNSSQMIKDWSFEKICDAIETVINDSSK